MRCSSDFNEIVVSFVNFSHKTKYMYVSSKNSFILKHLVHFNETLTGNIFL